MPRDIPNTNEIAGFIHCAKCLHEREVQELSMSPREYAQLEVGFTAQGVQIWCKRHECNVMHIDFQDAKHPANMDC